MSKLIPFLAVVLMAGPALLAFGQTGTYQDTFDNALPDQSWYWRDEGTNYEVWTPAGGPFPDSPLFDVTYGVGGDYVRVNDGDTNPADPVFVGSLLFNGVDSVIPYIGGVTARVTVNAAGEDIGHPPSLVAMLQETGGGGNAFYTFNFNPYWHNISLGCYKVEGGHQYWYRLANYVCSSGHGAPMWQIPIEMTFQVQTLENGNVSLIGLAYGDVPDDAPDQGHGLICALTAIVGETSPDQYQIDVVNQPGGPPYDPDIVPKLTYGAVGFGAGLQAESVYLGYSLDTTYDDFASWDPIPGDANVDGIVDDTDASIVGSHWMLQSGATWLMGDFNFDKKVDDRDAAILAAHYGQTMEDAGEGSVPEPSTATLLLGLVAAALAAWRRR